MSWSSNEPTPVYGDSSFLPVFWCSSSRPSWSAHSPPTTTAASVRQPPLSHSGAIPPGGLAGAMWTTSASPSPNGASSMSRPLGLPTPRGRCLTPTARWLAKDDDSSPNGSNFRIRRTLSAGTYYIRVYGYSTSTTGSYTLRVRFRASGDDHGGTRQTATPVSLRSDTSGWLGRGDIDYFRVTLSQRGLLHVETAGSTDTKGAVLDANGRWLAIDDDSSPNGNNFRIRRTLSAGTYYIRVYGYSTSTTGSYTLRVRFRGAPPPPPPPDEDAIDDIDVGVCYSEREVQLCVWDYACEDGDRIRIDVNGRVEFEGELYNRKSCFTVPVNQGRNPIVLTALNDTGPQGCAGSPAPPNTGALSVTGTMLGSGVKTQEWEHAGGTGSQANLNVTIDSQGRGCEELPPDSHGGPGSGSGGGSGSGRWYALATTQGVAEYPNCLSAGVSGTKRTESEARSEALAECRSNSCARNCQVEVTWQGTNCWAVYGCRSQDDTRGAISWATGPRHSRPAANSPKRLLCQ